MYFNRFIFFKCFLLAISAVLLLGCKGTGEEPEEQREEDTLHIEFDTKVLSNKASEFSFDVTANCDWSFSLDANWAYIIEPRILYSGSKTLTIGVLKNDTFSERTATFVFSYPSGSKVLKVIQLAFEAYLDVTVQEVQFGYRNAEKVIKVTSNCGWYAKSSEEWLDIRPVTGLVGSFEMTLEVQTNQELADRSATISIWNDKYQLSQFISVNQRGRPESIVKDYIDENGINRGEGIMIGNLEWAPVNCGYQEEDYPFGKIYQWGRKDGVGYHDSKFSDRIPTTIKEIWPDKNGSEDPNCFYKYGEGSIFNYDWLIEGDNSFWNKGTEEDPIKNKQFDPCPDGWRIPTAFEYNRLLLSSNKTWTTMNSLINGLALTDKSQTENTLFLPAGGRINALDGSSYERNVEGYYWTITSSEGSSAYLYFFEDGQSVNLYGSRSGGCSVRCVKE